VCVVSYNLLLVLLKCEIVKKILFTIILHGVHVVMWTVPCIWRFVAYIVLKRNLYCLMKAFRSTTDIKSPTLRILYEKLNLVVSPMYRCRKPLPKCIVTGTPENWPRVKSHDILQDNLIVW
jgi:hypothetical protein